MGERLEVPHSKVVGGMMDIVSCAKKTGAGFKRPPTNGIQLKSSVGV